MKAMNTLRNSEELETLKSDLRALRGDLRELGRDVGELTGIAARSLRQRAPVGEWWQRAKSLGAEGNRDEAIARLRGQGEKSAAALRSTVQEHPVGAALSALALGLAIAWLLTRSSSTR
jgi:hypothetical protein